MFARILAALHTATYPLDAPPFYTPPHLVVPDTLDDPDRWL